MHPDVTDVALELSSFQLETIETYRPDVAVWLNFAPDHMDRYHSLAEYRAAKERLFLNLQPGDTAIVPPDMSRHRRRHRSHRPHVRRGRHRRRLACGRRPCYPRR